METAGTRADSHQSRRLKGKRRREKHRSGREWRFKGARIKRSLSARGDVLTGRKPPPREEREVGREEGRWGGSEIGW